MPRGVADSYVEDVSRSLTPPAGCQRKPQPERFSDRFLYRHAAAPVAMGSPSPSEAGPGFRMSGGPQWNEIASRRGAPGLGWLIQEPGHEFGISGKVLRQPASHRASLGLDTCITECKMGRVPLIVQEGEFPHQVVTGYPSRAVPASRVCVEGRRAPAWPTNHVRLRAGPAAGSGSRGPPPRPA
jgi:hypothetical protein